MRAKTSFLLILRRLNSRQLLTGHSATYFKLRANTQNHDNDMYLLIYENPTNYKPHRYRIIVSDMQINRIANSQYFISVTHATTYRDYLSYLAYKTYINCLGIIHNKMFFFTVFNSFLTFFFSSIVFTRCTTSMIDGTTNNYGRYSLSR